MAASNHNQTDVHDEEDLEGAWHREHSFSNTTTDSSVSSPADHTPDSNVEEEPHDVQQVFVPPFPCQKIIKKCKSTMKMPNGKKLEQVNLQSLLSDTEVKSQWYRTCQVYHSDRQCNNYQRIEDEISEVFCALISDEKDVMKGLDSQSSFRDLVITAMRIASEPSLRLGIRIGLGGTDSPLNVRAPSYAIAGVYLLEQLLALRTQFSPTQSHSDVEHATTMLIHPPVLTFFCAYSTAVRVNRLNEDIAKERAHDNLSYIRNYIDHFYSDLSIHVRYETDHSESHKCPLLAFITQHYQSIHDDKIQAIKQSLLHQSSSHGSDEEGCAQYTSMHLIMAKDIIDLRSPQPLVPLFNDQILYDQNDLLDDCIITIGGPVEERFNQMRHVLREALTDKLQTIDADRYRFPLSIRMLSKAGRIPVYYANRPSDVTVDDVMQGRIPDLSLRDVRYKDISEDVLLLKHALGVHLFKSVWKDIPETASTTGCSWKNIVLHLVELCLQVWEAHAVEADRSCDCSTTNGPAIQQFYQHYPWSAALFDNERHLIIQEILCVLEENFGVPFGQPVTHPRRIYKRQQMENKVFFRFDQILGCKFLQFVRAIFTR